MSEIEIFGRVSEKFKKLTEYVALRALALAKQPNNINVAIEFVSEKKIRQLNKDFRNNDSVTDVLSFPSTQIRAGEIFDEKSGDFQMLFDGKNYHLGDIAICSAKIRSQAKQFGVTVESELKKLVIHSILHIIGYDHISDSDFEIMKEREDYFEKNIDIKKFL